MTTYKEIRGQLIRKVSEDPTNPVEGQIWYNTTTGILKGLPALEAWVSGASGIQARRLAGGFGIQTATVAVGGVGPNPTVFDDTEHYNGSGWSAAEDYPSLAYGVAGCGTQTAGLAWGGKFPPAYSDTSNTYNGSSWTSAPTLNTARAHTSNNIGAQTSALCAGGGEPLKAVTEEFDGSSWSESGDLSTARQGMAAGGTQTASFVAGGEGPAPGAVALTEEYNGTSWTAGGALNTARLFLSGTGPLTAGIAFAGSEPSNSNKTEKYDGTTWSVAPTLGTARQAGMGAGADNTSALAAFGATGPTALLSISEEFTRSTNVITAAAFASGGALNTARAGMGDTGTTDAAFAFGGNGPNAQAEQYNGSSWTEVGDLNTSRGYLAGAGTQTAGLGFGGYVAPPNRYLNLSEEFDGSSWTEGNNLNTGRDILAGCGTQTAGLAFGGFTPGNTGATEEYDGTSWSEQNDLNVARRGLSGCGTQTAGLAAGGEGPNTAATEEYDGTSWTTSGNLNLGREGLAAGGVQTSSLVAGGNLAGPTKQSLSEQYDGTSWTTSASMANIRDSGGGSGDSNTSALMFGGRSGPNTPFNATEEFVAGSTSLNIKTLTTS